MSQQDANDVERFTGPGGLPMVRLRRGESVAEVSLYGAHVTRYAVGGDEVLFVSEHAHLDGAKPIRGGVPICFPWFGGNGPEADSPSHGFARITHWEVARAAADAVTLRLDDSEHTREFWPMAFGFEYTVTLDDALRLSATVTNAGPKTISYELALHTYLRVGDVRNVAIEGFDGCAYVDQLSDDAHIRQEGEPRVTSEVDRIYQGHTADVRVAEGGRTTVVAKRGGQSTVLWNPHVDKAARLSDFGDDEWPRMLCVESAAIGEHAIALAAGASHTLSQTISLRTRAAGADEAPAA